MLGVLEKSSGREMATCYKRDTSQYAAGHAKTSGDHQPRLLILLPYRRSIWFHGLPLALALCSPFGSPAGLLAAAVSLHAQTTPCTPHNFETVHGLVHGVSAGDGAPVKIQARQGTSEMLPMR